MNLCERTANFDPVDVPLADVLPRKPAVAAIEVEVLQVNLDNARPQGADPVLRERIDDDVADVEVRADPWRIELVDIPRELQWTQQKLVPDLFDGNDHLQVAGHRHEALADYALRSRIRILVRRSRIDHGGNEQDGIRAP